MQKTILVTGGNRGIGKAICLLLLKNPSVHVLMASRNLDRGTEAAQEIKEQIGSKLCEGRLDVVEMDVSSDASVAKAAAEIAAKHNSALYGIVNNAGILDGEDVMNTNYFGTRRVNDAMASMLQRPGGKIVNVGSASGPMHVASLRDRDLKSKLAKPWLIGGGIAELDDMARSVGTYCSGDPYGCSKAFVSAYTSLHAHDEPDLFINAVTPGFIASDMGKLNGATKPCSEGAVPVVHLLMSPEVENAPAGRYYGSDMKRSPLDRYRGPGDPVYVGPDWA